MRSGSQKTSRPRDKKNGELGEKVIDISFNSDSVMEVETDTGTATQTEEFGYLFHTSTDKPTFDETWQMTMRR